ncbi:vitamin K epoxide reductase family protein [Lentzea californiensis]|uniref:vitamin K epoxide reductase family protein n=1 Tax=Lentzea californiensis TaxID=438851 RepID=UPI002165592E|nr:vitamin K epoxide reductase family protein [Lentzea californiensis]MCR3750459.1 putative membrane protein [Lentzea californiensis]
MTRLLPWLLVAGGGIGLVAAFVLTVEKIALLKDTDYVPACSINPVLSCGSIMKTEQAEVFGFPNPLLGIAGFAALVTIGVVLATGSALPRWCWLGLQTGVTFGVVFVHWLIFQSLYVIGALCPYCMAVWAVMIPIFWYTTLHNLEQGHLPSPRRATAAFAGYHSVVLILWYLLIAGAVLQAFWFYWTTLVE